MGDLLLPAFEGDPPSIPRDHYGRPLIGQPDGKPIGYTRTTTISEQLADTRALETWKERQVARGMSQRPDLVLAAQQLTDSAADRKPLNRLTSEAHKQAGSGDKAANGTLIHAITEAEDRGDDTQVPKEWKHHVATYRRMTEGCEHLHREQMTIHDDNHVAGTPDHISLWPQHHYGKRKRRPRIGDLKTGGVLDYGIREIAAQLAIYANAQWLYNWETEERLPMPEGLDKDIAVIIHIPQDGGGRGRLYEVDIAAGWVAAQHCMWTHQWKKKKVANLTSQLDFGDPLEEWLRGRILSLSTYPDARPYLAQHLKPEFGSLSTGINLDLADELVEVLEMIETFCQAPFPERDPRTPTPKRKKR